MIELLGWGHSLLMMLRGAGCWPDMYRHANELAQPRLGSELEAKAAEARAELAELEKLQQAAVGTIPDK